MKTYTGKIIANKMVNTVVIEKINTYTHPLYKKTISRSKNIKAHTDIVLNIGDWVKYSSCRPVSKEIHFKVIEKTEKK